ncbi:MAG: hypothetical protein ACLP1X_12435 [Polyangiaceae bacterium]|jgi:hypothetical protein
MRRLVASAVVLLSLAPGSAFADVTKDQCIEANARGQELRQDGKLSAAREQLRLCGNPACPAMVRDDCTRRLDELDKVQPTIVFVAKDAAGRDVAGVAVAIDGKPLAARLDGAELRVDPGEHVFMFTAPGQPPVSRTLVLAAGEKDRREEVVVGGVAPIPAPHPPQAQPAHLVVTASDAATIAIDGQVVATGRLDASEAPGPHELLVTGSGMRPYKAEIDLRDGETRTLEVSLEAEHHTMLWPWIAGGAAVVAGAIVGGYFLFKSSPGAPANPPDQLGSATVAAFR